MIRNNKIRNLLATTALATFVATGAFAQSTTPAPMTPAEPAAPVEQVKRAEGHLTSNVVGMTVYNGTGNEAENIGKVTDLVMSPEGQIEAVVIGVGGFLGIGRKDVAIEYDLVEWAEMDGNEFLVVETTAEALKAQQEFDRAAYEPMPADMDVAETKPATAEDLANAPVEEEAADDTAAAPATTEQPAAGTEQQDTAAAPATTGEAVETQQQTATAEQPAADTEQQQTATAEQPAADTEQQDTAAADSAETPADKQTIETAQAPATDETQTGAIDRSTLQDVDTATISAEDFVGTRVYGANEENIGEIGDVILSQDGQVDAVIIDVGGFLGIGEKEIAVGMDNLQFMQDGDGNRYLYTEFTKEQLEAQPAYDEATYAQNRDTMRMTVQ